MSLVGTRPPTVDEYEQYELVHRKRLAVKPGITGMWQVSGRSRITDFDKVVASLNFYALLEEEIDFEGLSDYIRGKMIEDIKLRCFGNCEN